MSAVPLARRLAMRRYHGDLLVLPRFTPADEPRRVRAHLLAFYALLDAISAERAARAAAGAALSDRLMLAGIADEIREAIGAARECLSSIARHGGRGVSAGAGRSPAVKAQGCAALASAVGPASTMAGSVAECATLHLSGHAMPAGRFLSPAGAELAISARTTDRQSHQGGQP